MSRALTALLRVIHIAAVLAICAALWVLLTPLAVRAQPVTEPPPACAPSQAIGGTGTRAITRIVDSPLVMCARWWCPPAGGVGEWRGAKAAFLPTYFLQPRRDEFVAAAERGDAVWLLAQRNRPMSDANFVRCTDAPELLAAWHAARPATSYLYRVAPNPQSTATPPTRPVYQLINGARAPWAGPRAVVGEGCRPEIARDGDYMAFGPGFAVDLVALCK